MLTSMAETLILNSPKVRALANDWIRRAPDGSHVTFERPKHSDGQRDLLWELLGQLAKKATYYGLKLPKEEWKLIFLSGVRKGLRIVPNLDNDGFISLDRSIKPLNKAEMKMMIELVEMWADQNGTTLVRTIPGYDEVS